MKKIHFIIGILALAVCGCVKEEATSSGGTAPVGEMVKVRLSTIAPPEILGPETRTSLNDDEASVSWNADDEIIIYANPSGTVAEHTIMSNKAGNGPVGIFEGTVPASWLKNSRNEVAYYPGSISEWSSEVTFVGTGIGVNGINYPAVQPLCSGSFAPGYNLSVAFFELSGDNEPLRFQNVCGLLKVSLSGNTKVKSIAITAPDVVAASKCYVRKNNGVMEIGKEGTKSNTVTLTSAEGIALSTEKQNFYACVLPYTKSGSYIVAVETFEGKTATEEILMGTGVASGELLELADITVNYTYEDHAAAGVDLNTTGEPVILNYVGEVPAVSSDTADWLKDNVTVADGKITISAGVHYGAVSRTGNLVLVSGGKTVTIEVRQAAAPVLEKMSLEFYGQADSKDISKTEYMPEGYTAEVDAAYSGWLTASESETGVTVSVLKNETGAVRNGKIEVKDAGGNVVATVDVVQKPVYEYEMLLGEYSISCIGLDGKQKDTYTFKIEAAVASGEEGYGEEYKATFSVKEFNYPFTLIYNADHTVAPVSLICPQDCAYTKNFDAWLHVTKKPTSSGFIIKKDFASGSSDYTEIDVTDAGVGYDLTVDDSDGKFNLIFVPNALAQEKYPDSIEGLWIPGRTTAEGAYNRIKDWIRPLAGQEYLKITRKTTQE